MKGLSWLAGVVLAAPLTIMAGSPVFARGFDCTPALLDGLYVFTATGFAIPTSPGPALPQAIVELIRFKGDGTASTPGVSLSLNGTIIVLLPGDSGTYTVTDLVPKDDACIGNVTFSVSGASRRNLSAGKPRKALATNSMASVRVNGLKFLTENPSSPESEAIRNLETAIRIPVSASGAQTQTVLITSALPGEGKTTVATNLALALARHGNTCLVDADFRHPSITPSFSLSQRAGLQDLLASPDSTTQDVLKPLPEIPNLTVIGVGNRWPHALETLTSKRMSELLNDLRKKFDYIVLDSPPIIPFSEGRWLSTVADASILVARCNTTTRGAITSSLEILEDLKAPILGVVLNGVDLNAEYYSYGVKEYPSYAK